MSLAATTRAGQSASYWLFGIALVLLSQQIFVNLISERFLFEIDVARAPIRAYVFSQIAAGFVFLSLLLLIPKIHGTKSIWLLVLLSGLALRLSLFGSNPILEVDFYRYLWDGAVTASGFNPWQYSPGQIAIGTASGLQPLAEDAGLVLERINYADLRSIYPPVSQLFFALSFWLDSWNLDAWRLILLACDIATLFLIIKILDAVNRARLWSLIYWWNPLLIHETYNTLHMDVLILPFLLLAVLWMIHQRFIAASAALTLAAGIKLWPLLLLPFALRPLLDKPRQLLIALLAISAVAVVVIGPLLYFGLGEHSGLQGYSQSWLRNSALFPLLKSVLADSELLSRGFVALALTTLVLYLNRQPVTNNNQLMRNLCWVVTALFLLSPTQFPWYSIWFAPLLCFYPKPALLLLFGLMPIYYLRVYWSAKGNVEFFDDVIVWFQYLPVYGLLLFDLIRQRTQRLSVGYRV